MIQCIIAPEFVLGFATGQKADARRSVQEFKRVGYDQWTIRHAFYANMGGFILQPRDNEPPFPITAKQLLYLITRDYTPIPTLSEEEVWDKSKADNFAKAVTCLQGGWFIAQIIGRAAQHLEVTTLELITLTFVFCTLASFYQWLNKPLDVDSPTIINISVSTDEIRERHGGSATKEWKMTPLDFIDDHSPSWLTEVQPHLKFKLGPQERPITRLTNDRFPVIGAGPDAIALLVCTLVYCGLHFIGWNFSFPTKIEHTLWRACSCSVVGTAFVLWVCETIQDGHRLGRWEKWYAQMFPAKGEFVLRRWTTEKLEGRAPFIPLWEVIVMTPMTVIYTLARAFVVVEAFASLRSLPEGAYVTVQWTDYIPHY